MIQQALEERFNVVNSLKSNKITRLHGINVRHAPFAVLRSTIPSALIELGHLSNADEEKLLNSDSYQDKLVSAITSAIGNYNFDI